jgi:serine protease inhibitor
MVKANSELLKTEIPNLDLDEFLKECEKKLVSLKESNHKLYGDFLERDKISTDILMKEPRRGARLANEFAFDIYKKIAEEKGKFYFSPYGIFDALWGVYLTSGSEVQEEFQKSGYFNDENRDSVIKLKETIYKEMERVLTNAEEYAGTKVDFYLAFFRQREFFEDNRVSMSSVEGLDLINTTSFVLPFSRMAVGNQFFVDYFKETLERNDASLLDYKQLYARTDDVEIMRISFWTAKHSFIYIKPNKNIDFEKFEKEMGPEWLGNLLSKMKETPLRYLDNAMWKHSEMSTIELNFLPSIYNIYEKLPKSKIFKFTHNAYFYIDYPYAPPFSKWKESPHVVNYPNRYMYEMVMTILMETTTVCYTPPCLYFIIDDLTGAILFMGRDLGAITAS